MKRLSVIFVTGCALFLAMSAARAADSEITLSVDPTRVVGHIDEKIYGQFLEHIYHSVNGGLWGEMIWNRSFEQTAADKAAPATMPAKPAAKFWAAYGKATIEQIKDNPLNSEYCLQITGAGGEAGIQQTTLCIRDGETYHCSMWVRGTCPAGWVVRLVDGSKILVEQPIVAPFGGIWQQYSFDLVPNGSAENGAIQIGMRDKGKICIDQVSMMPDAARNTGGFRPDLLAAIAELKPPVIRWPGGSFASKYRWKNAIGPQEQRRTMPSAMWDDQDCNSFGTDEYIALCRKVGAQPLIVVNVGPHKAISDVQRAEFLQDACDWVEYCNGPITSTWGKLRARNGHPKPYGVKFWEIDNEVWGFKPDDYVAVLKQFVPAMKKIDPTISIIACGSGQLGGHWADGDMAVIDGAASLIDYLSVHHYEKPERFAEGPAAADAFFRKLAARIAQSSNPKLKLYVSEWNAQSTDWRTGLYAGGILNTFERGSDFIGMAGPALFLRHVSAKAWDNAFINFDNRTWFAAPNDLVMKLYRENFAADRLELVGNAGPLNAVATRSPDGKKIYLKVVNPSDQAVSLSLQIGYGFAPIFARMKLIAPDSLTARNTLDARDAIAPADARVAREGGAIRCQLPRWSVAVVSIYSGGVNPATLPSNRAGSPATAPTTAPAAGPAAAANPFPTTAPAAPRP